MEFIDRGDLVYVELIVLVRLVVSIVEEVSTIAIMNIFNRRASNTLHSQVAIIIAQSLGKYERISNFTAMAKCRYDVLVAQWCPNDLVIGDRTCHYQI